MSEEAPRVCYTYEGLPFNASISIYFCFSIILISL